MAVFLLHIRSRIHIDIVEGGFDALEQEFLPEEHYVLSREGYVVNYLVRPDRSPSEFYEWVRSKCADVLLDQISLVGLGRDIQAIEQDYQGHPAPDFCGEWRRVRNEESFQYEELRVRTGVNRWFKRHAEEAPDAQVDSKALFLYLNRDMDTSERWLDRFRDLLGPTTRPHFRDERSVLLTFRDDRIPRKVLLDSKVQRYLDERVHMAACVSLTGNEFHIAGSLQNVMPPKQSLAAPVRPMTGSNADKLFLVQSAPERLPGLNAALERLRAGRKS